MQCEQRVLHCPPRCQKVLLTQLQISHFCSVTLKNYSRNWTHCVSHTNTWTVSIHYSSIDWKDILLSRVVKCLIMCKEQSIFFKETGVWTECAASQKGDSWGKSTENTHWVLPEKKWTETSGSVFAERTERKKDKLWTGTNRNCRLFPRWLC